MRLASLREAYAEAGPYATAYLAPDVPDAEAADHLQLRWKHLAGQLADQGAPAADVDAIAALVEEGRGGRVFAAGLVAVAASGRVLFSDRLRGPVGGDSARWSFLPDLAPYVRANADDLVELVVIVDRAGADLVVREEGDRQVASLDGQTHPLHKVRGGGWSHRRIQSRVEEVADKNAALVAEEVDRLARSVRHAVVILAGDVEARARVLPRLGAAVRPLVREAGGAARGVESLDGLGERFEAVLDEVRAEESAELLDRIRAAVGTGLAVEGLAGLVAAARQGALDTVVLASDNPDAGTAGPAAATPLAVGPEPLQLALTDEDFRAMYGDVPLRHDRADAALLRAGVGTDATAAAVGPDTGLADGMAALLRFAVPE